MPTTTSGETFGAFNDGFVRIKKLEFDETTLRRRICEIAGPQPEDRMIQICEKFRYIATKYLTYEAQAEAQMPVSRIRADLVAFRKYLRRGEPFFLGMLHWSVEGALFDAWFTLGKKGVSITDVMTKGDRMHLLEATTQALRRLPQRPGRRMAHANLLFLVSGLCEIYTQLTGRRVVHNPQSKGDYTGRPHSTSGRFVVDCIKLIRLDVPETAVSQSLAKYVFFARRKQAIGFNRLFSSI